MSVADLGGGTRVAHPPSQFFFICVQFSENIMPFNRLVPVPANASV